MTSQFDRRAVLRGSTALSLAFVASACGGSDGESGTTVVPTPTPTPPPYQGAAVSLTADMSLADFTALPLDTFQLNGFSLTIVHMADTARRGIFVGDGVVIIKSGLARPEWWEKPSYRRAALALMAGGGGRVELQAARYSSESSGSEPLPLSNVHFAGAGQPVYADNNSTLLGGTILEGPVIFGSVDKDGNVLGDNIIVSNLGVDSGHTVGKGADLEGLVLPNFGQIPDGTQPLRTGILIQDVTVLCSSATAPVHCILVEQAQGPIVQNVTTMFGVTGIAMKTRSGVVDTATMQGHATNAWIDKSDSYSVSANNIWRNLTMRSVNLGDTYGGRIFCGSAPNSGHRVSNVNAQGTNGIVSIEPAAYSMRDIILSDVTGNNIHYYGVAIWSGASEITVDKRHVENVTDAIDGTSGNGMQIAAGAYNIAVADFQSANTAGDGIQNNGDDIRVSDSVAASPGVGRFGFNGVSGSMSLTRCSGSAAGAITMA